MHGSKSTDRLIGAMILVLMVTAFIAVVSILVWAWIAGPGAGLFTSLVVYIAAMCIFLPNGER